MQQFKLLLTMSHQKSKSAAKKLPNRSPRSGAITRATSRQQHVTTSQDATGNPARRATKRRSNNSPRNPPATKRLQGQGLTRNNISKIVKLVLDAISDDVDDTDQDVSEIETPTADETKDESVT